MLVKYRTKYFLLCNDDDPAQGISKYSKGIDKRPEQGWKRLLTSLLMPCRNKNNRSIQYNTNSYVNKDIHLSDVGFRLTHRVVAYQIFG